MDSHTFAKHVVLYVGQNGIKGAKADTVAHAMIYAARAATADASGVSPLDSLMVVVNFRGYKGIAASVDETVARELAKQGATVAA